MAAVHGEYLRLDQQTEMRVAALRESIWARIGDLRLAMDDTDGALRAFETVLHSNPENMFARTQIGAAFAKKGMFHEAIQHLERVHFKENDPTVREMKIGDVLSLLAHCFVMTDQLDRAYKAYSNALSQVGNPKDPSLWYGIGLLYDRCGSMENALEAFQAVLSIDPNFHRSEEVCFCIGVIFKEQGKLDESLSYFMRTISAGAPPHPLTYADTLYQIAHVNELKKDFTVAIETYKKALACNPMHNRSLQQLGWIQHIIGNSEDAIRMLTRAAELCQTDGQAYYLLGRVYMATQVFRKAYDAYQEAVHRDQSNSTYWCSIGVLYYQMQQHSDALDAYARAIRLNPHVSESWYDLGTLFESCSQPEDAIVAYRRAARIAPDSEQIAQRLNKLEHQQPAQQPTMLQHPPAPGQDIGTQTAAVIPPQGRRPPKLPHVAELYRQRLLPAEEETLPPEHYQSLQAQPSPMFRQAITEQPPLMHPRPVYQAPSETLQAQQGEVLPLPSVSRPTRSVFGGYPSDAQMSSAPPPRANSMKVEVSAPPSVRGPAERQQYPATLTHPPAEQPAEHPRGPPLPRRPPDVIRVRADPSHVPERYREETRSQDAERSFRHAEERREVSVFRKLSSLPLASGVSRHGEEAVASQSYREAASVEQSIPQPHSESGASQAADGTADVVMEAEKVESPTDPSRPPVAVEVDLGRGKRIKGTEQTLGALPSLRKPPLSELADVAVTSAESAGLVAAVSPEENGESLVQRRISSQSEARGGGQAPSRELIQPQDEQKGRDGNIPRDSDTAIEGEGPVEGIESGAGLSAPQKLSKGENTPPEPLNSAPEADTSFGVDEGCADKTGVTEGSEQRNRIEKGTAESPHHVETEDESVSAEEGEDIDVKVDEEMREQGVSPSVSNAEVPVVVTQRSSDLADKAAEQRRSLGAGVKEETKTNLQSDSLSSKGVESDKDDVPMSKSHPSRAGASSGIGLRKSGAPMSPDAKSSSKREPPMLSLPLSRPPRRLQTDRLAGLKKQCMPLGLGSPSRPVKRGSQISDAGGGDPPRRSRPKTPTFRSAPPPKLSPVLPVLRSSQPSDRGSMKGTDEDGSPKSCGDKRPFNGKSAYEEEDEDKKKLRPEPSDICVAQSAKGSDLETEPESEPTVARLSVEDVVQEEEAATKREEEKKLDNEVKSREPKAMQEENDGVPESQEQKPSEIKQLDLQSRGE